MPEWEDYAEDDWMLPASSKETRIKVVNKDETRGVRLNPKVDPAPWKSGDHVAGFELDEQLGSGSQGWVFAARELSTGRAMAIKLFHIADKKKEADHKAALRAKTGFRRMSKLRHGGLVRVHRIHHDGNAIAFSMELIRGNDLVASIREWRSLPLADACDRVMGMLHQVASALAWMHAHKFIHRDIKPTNIMVSEDGNRFVIIDCDLMGTVVDSGMCENARAYMIFTPMYVAPEVLYRQCSYPASDIFSLGMVVLEALRVISSAQRRRDRDADSLAPSSDLAIPCRDTVEFETDGDQAPTVSEQLQVPRDEKDIETDRLHIVDALTGLHPDIPELLVDTVTEMVSPDVFDRPTANSLSRIGQPITSSLAPIRVCQQSTRAQRITTIDRASELDQFQRACHLVLGGNVQRLHVEGASGIGKSTFLDLSLDSLRLQSWAQIFVARCQKSEERPLQAFSQIADDIVMQYRRGGFERLKLDSVCESILRQALPGFEEALEVDYSLPPLVTSPTRPGGLDAAILVCNQLRRTGPVFFVIDDVQWADGDTLNVLDHLQSFASQKFEGEALQGLGLITVSRPDGDCQAVSPDQTIRIGPLSRQVVGEALREEAENQQMSLRDDAIASLSEQIEGLPYRLEAYLSELAPTGILSSEVELDPQNVPTITQVWQHRKQQLDHEELELMTSICLAGRHVTLDELQCFFPSLNALDAHLDGLSDRRLIVRDGDDGELIRVWHDRLTEQWIKQLDPAEIQSGRREWAEMLAETGSGAASEIALHYEAAGQNEQFVVWARAAASEAMSVLAHLEAGRWHERVGQHLSGAGRREAYLAAADSFQRGGRLIDASRMYEAIAASIEGPAKTEAELEHAQTLIRSGRFAEISDQLLPLLARLRLPTKKSAWLTKLNLLGRVLRLKAVRFAVSGRDASAAAESRTALQSSQILACQRLVRPLSYIDNWLSAEMNLFIADLVARVGTRDERIEVAVGEAVFGSYYTGRAQNAAIASLARLQAELPTIHNPSSRGDVFAGLAWSHGMRGIWNEVPALVDQARAAYLQSEDYRGFEIAHTCHVEAMAYFQLGQLDRLAAMVDDMQSEMSTTSDQFIMAMGSLGFSSVVFLIRGERDPLRAIQDQLSGQLLKVGDDGFAFINIYTELLLCLTGKSDSRTRDTLQRLEQVVSASSLGRVQILTLMHDELQAFARLRLLPEGNPDDRKQLRRLIKKIRGNKLPFSSMKADLIEGLWLARDEKGSRNHASRIDQARALLESAVVAGEQQKLLPSVFAAQDELDRLNSVRSESRLEAFLAERGAVEPAKIASIYRG